MASSSLCREQSPWGGEVAVAGGGSGHQGPGGSPGGEPGRCAAHRAYRGSLLAGTQSGSSAGGRRLWSRPGRQQLTTQGSVPVAPRDRPTRLRPWVSLGVPSMGAFLTHQSPTWKRSKRELILPGWRSPRFVLPGAEVLLSTCCMQASVSGLRPREDWESGVSQPQRSCGALTHWPLSSAPRESLHGTWGSLPVGLAVDSCFCVLPSRGGSLGPAGTARGSGDRWAREDSPRQPSVRAGALVGRSLPDTAVSRACICRGVKW